MQNSLFSDFDEITAKQWKQKIQYELKGEDYNQTLLTRTAEDINIKPFYQGVKDDPITMLHNGWEITEKIYVKNPSASNYSILKALENGAESLYLTIANKDISIEEVLDQVPLAGLQIDFEF